MFLEGSDSGSPGWVSRGVGLEQGLVAVLLAALLVACSPRAQAGDPTPLPLQTDAALEAEVDDIFREHDSTHSPGCAVAVVQEGQLVLSQGYGVANLDHRIPLRSTSVFRIASVSKQFTAAAILLLAHDGVLALDDDVRRFIPELPEFDRTITIGDLIHHTSGLRDYLVLLTLSGVPITDEITDTHVLDLLSRQEDLNFPPGQEFLYSNTGYVLLAEIVRRASGESLRQYARERLFRPLGMQQTHFHDDAGEVVPERATGYAVEGGQYKEAVLRMSIVGDGGLFTSVRDLARWESVFVGPLPPEQDPRHRVVRILREGMTRLGHQAGGSRLNYGFGTYRSALGRLETVEHSGSFAGYEANVIRVPSERTSIMVLCNVSSAGAVRLSREVGRAFLGHRTGPIPELDERAGQTQGAPEPDFQPDSETLEEQIGDYWSPELQVTYRIRRLSDYLRLEEPALLASALRPMEEDVYRLGGAVLRFQRDREGAIQGFRLDTGRALNLRFDRVEAGEEPGESDGR
jgi:CubicO group peptidase (beta-lactamase class C family)